MLEFCGILLSLLATLASTSATRPATAPADRQFLAHGTISYAPPPGWQRQGTQDNPNASSYRRDDQTATILIINTPQEIALTDSIRIKLAQAIGKKIRDDLKSNGHESLIPPRIEEDPELFLRIHDRFVSEGKQIDRLHLYRSLGLNLLMVSISTWSDSPQANAEAFEAAREMALDAQIQSPQTPATQPAEPASLPKARLRVIPPSGWVAQWNDAPDGIVATFHDPHVADNNILLLACPIPEDIRHNSDARAKLIDELDQRAQNIYRPESARSGAPQQINDRRFIRKTITQHHLADGRVEVACRMVRADQVLVEVISISRSEQSRLVMKLADELALDVLPMEDQP
jgi:hypothetical protein